MPRIRLIVLHRHDRRARPAAVAIVDVVEARKSPRVFDLSPSAERTPP
jgi:hypothetical protein